MKRIGIIGAGSMGKYHASRWARLPVELVGFYDVLQDKREAAAAQFGAKAFDSREALLDAVDVVVVTTPTDLHHEVVMAAAGAGKDIFCEKPLARHLRHCAEMMETCQASGSRLFVGQVVRFFPEFAAAKGALDRGDIGKPGVIRTTRGGAQPTSSSWYANVAKSGGVILDLSIHDLDYVRWCCGDVERVFARSLTGHGVQLKDHALITLRFKSGAIGHVEGSWAYAPGTFVTRVEIAGDAGLIEFDSSKSAPLVAQIQEDPSKPAALAIPESPLAPEDDPYYIEDKHFLECLISGRDFSVTAMDGLQAVKLGLAALHSVHTGQPVDLDTFEEVEA